MQSTSRPVSLDGTRPVLSQLLKLDIDAVHRLHVSRDDVRLTLSQIIKISYWSSPHQELAHSIALGLYVCKLLKIDTDAVHLKQCLTRWLVTYTFTNY